MVKEQNNIDYWVSLCKEGHENGFMQIYQAYSKQMFSIALRILQDRQEAEDVLQESFIKVFKNIQSFKGDASFGSWLKRIVINHAINQIKKKKSEFDNIDTIGTIIEDEEIIYPTLSVDEIQSGINQLPDGYRIVLTLFLLEGYSHKEIADELGISESTSKTQYKRAKTKLRDLLTEKIMLQ